MGSDNIVKVCHFEVVDSPAILLELKEEGLVDACWLESNPNSLAVITSEGKLYIFNLAVSAERAEETISLPLGPNDYVHSLLDSPSQSSLTVFTEQSSVMQCGYDLQEEPFLLDRIYMC